MAFNVSLYNFSKRENSTKRPDTDPVSFQCILKEGSSIITPTISLDLGLGADPSAYNYAYIPEYGRYYYIQNWYFDNALWTASMIVDVLATFKNEIGYTSLYVLRSSAAYDGSIIDGLYPTNTDPTYHRTTADIYTADVTAGTFVIGVVSSDGHYGSLEYYAIKHENMQTLINYLLNNAITEGNGYSLDDATIELQKSLIDPLSYIKTCVYIPIPFNSFWGAAREVRIWSWNTGVSAKRIGQYVDQTVTATLGISRHPQAAARGSYLNSAPYTDIRVLLQPFGEIQVDPMMVRAADGIDLSLRIDMTNGLGVLTLRPSGSNYILSQCAAQVGVSVSLSQVTRDYLAAAGGAIQAIGGIAGGILSGDVGGAIGSAGAGIINGIKAMVPRQSTMMGSGSFGALGLQATMIETFYYVVPEDNDHHGRPLCQMRTPSSLGGYMIVQDGDVPTSGTQSETAEIKSYLESGFFYE